MSQETKPLEKKDDFESKHEKELGFKRFAYIQSLYLFVPIITGAAGFLLGYATLGKPLTKIFPGLSGFAGGVEKISANFKNLSHEHALEAARLHREGKSGKEIMELLGMKLDEVPKTAKVAGGWGLAFISSVLGSIGVGYDKWRKDESARLAANEVNKDIANLELFKPSNPELVAENKRLRVMLAQDAPHTKVSHTKHDGMTHEPHEKQLA